MAESAIAPTLRTIWTSDVTNRGAFTVECDLTRYDYIIVVGEYGNVTIVPKGASKNMWSCIVSEGQQLVEWRGCTCNANSVVFTAASYRYQNGGSNSGVTNCQRPIRIIAAKD